MGELTGRPYKLSHPPIALTDNRLLNNLDKSKKTSKIKIGAICSLSFIIISYLVFRGNLPKIPIIFLYNLIIIIALQEMGFYRGLFFLGSAVFLIILFSLAVDFYYIWNIPVFFITFLIVNERIKKLDYTIRITESRIEETKEKTNLLIDEYNRHKKDALFIEKRQENYRLLEGVASVLGSTLCLDKVSDCILDSALKIIGKSNAALLFLVDTQKQELNLFTSKIERPSEKVKAKKGDALDEWIFKQRKCLLVDDIKKDFRFPEENNDEYMRDFRSIIACPLMQERKVIGILRLEYSRPYNYTSEDLRLLNILCDMGAGSLENAKLYKQTLELAITDGLTGLYLRRYFQDRVREEIDRSLRHNLDCSFLMVDIDNFKNYNDKYGHTAGDIVLKSISNLLRQIFGELAIIGRYGGEEFSVFLPETSKRNAEKIADNIRERVKSKIIEFRRIKTSVTVSIGIASFPCDTKVYDELISKADERLYMAKRQGKDKVVA